MHCQHPTSPHTPRSPKRALVLWVLATALLTHPQPAHAQDTTPKEIDFSQVFRAIACYGNFNYTCTLDILGPFPTLYPAPNPNAIADPNPKPSPPNSNLVLFDISLEVGRILGVSYLATNQPDKAREVFHWTLSLRPSFILEGPEVPPEYQRVFLHVRAQRTAPFYAARIHARSMGLTRSTTHARNAAQRAQHIARIPKTPNDPNSPLHLRSKPSIHAQWIPFLGSDNQRIQPGFGARLNWALHAEGTPWHIGLDLDYNNHPVPHQNLILNSDLTLHTTHLDLFARLDLAHYKAWTVSTEAGLGISTFGVQQLFDQLASNLYTQPSLHLSLNTWCSLRVGPLLRALLINTPSGWSTSWTIAPNVGLEIQL